CKLAIHNGAHGRVCCIEERYTCGYCYTLCNRPNFEPEVLLDVILNVDNQAKQIDLLKPLLLDTDLVLPRLNACKNIDSGIVRSRGCDRPTLHTLKSHFRSRHGGSRTICDQPRNRSGLRLPYDTTSKPQDHE